MTLTATEAGTTNTLADDLRRLADMVDANTMVAEHVGSQIRQPWKGDTSTRLLVPVGSAEDPVAAMREFARAALDAGARVEKAYSDTYGAINLLFPGGMCLYVYAAREAVCERVVKGTREVERETDACPVCQGPVELTPSGATTCREHGSEHYRAEPLATRTVTETVEDVEWVCKPILSEQQAAS